ncbi:MAG: N-acetyltransferase [Alphaproteobacteria bacterium]|nr:N-acetyltransferase [Alphaproteobacteria bacterium]
MSTVTARIVGGAEAIGRTAWNACANPLGRSDPHPFTTYEFFSALEDTGCASPRSGWQPVHLVLTDGDRIVGLMPLYAKSHSRGEYVFDWGWAEAFEHAGGDYYPKLQAAVPFTPATGRRLLVAEDAPGDASTRLLKAAASAVDQLGCSSLHVTFMTADEWQQAGQLGFLQRNDQQFHWQNQGYVSFDDFLGQLASSKRKNLRKERAAVAASGIEFDWLTGRDLTEDAWDHFFAFYMDTGSRKWGTPYLTREFFSVLGERLRDQILLVMARRGRRWIAGALNLFGEEVLFGRNWGAIEYIPFLHFETCYYQAVEFAITQKLAKVEAGAQGEHKLLRGYMPVATYSAHFISHPGLRKAVSAFLREERAAVSASIEHLAEHGPYKKDH